jgi:biopolymer transport protein ExbD
MSNAPVLDDEEVLEQVSFKKNELPKDDMDMTPMVDVTFLLLIFFMITASFSSEKVFEKPPPLSETPSSKPPDNPIRSGCRSMNSTPTQSSFQPAMNAKQAASKTCFWH